MWCSARPTRRRFRPPKKRCGNLSPRRASRPPPARDERRFRPKTRITRTDEKPARDRSERSPACPWRAIARARRTVAREARETRDLIGCSPSDVQRGDDRHQGASPRGRLSRSRACCNTAQPLSDGIQKCGSSMDPARSLNDCFLKGKKKARGRAPRLLQFISSWPSCDGRCPSSWPSTSSPRRSCARASSSQASSSLLPSFIPPSGLAGCDSHSNYIRSSLRTYRI